MILAGVLALHFIEILLDRTLPPRYNIAMSYNPTTVPCAVEDKHNLSLSLGKAFAQSYALYGMIEETTNLLDIYRSSRRAVTNEKIGESRYGSYDAYEATQSRF